MLNPALALQANQLVDSKLETTRIFWRKKLGFSDEIAHDPRPLMEVLKEKETTHERENDQGDEGCP